MKLNIITFTFVHFHFFKEKKLLRVICEFNSHDRIFQSSAHVFVAENYIYHEISPVSK